MELKGATMAERDTETGLALIVGAGRCDHPNIERPEFDPERAKGLSAYEVRKLFPRKMVRCPDCGDTILMYASWQHYVAGDW